MRLMELHTRLTGVELHGDVSLELTGVTHDSRRVQPGGVFVAIRGQKTDGNRFVESALKRGAVAVVSDQPARAGVTWFQVPDARQALAEASAAVFGDPADSLELIGVTGTNGKTTTAHLVDAALSASGLEIGSVGTVEHRVGARLAEASRTTPESSDLHALFREMVDAGCSHAVLEVSSHALSLKRVHGLRFRVAIFTNLTRDHLDYHGDMDHYFEAKRLLFDTLLREDGHAVVNVGDDRGRELAALSRGRVWSYSLQGPADLWAGEIVLSLTGTRFRARTPVGDFAVETPLLGRFNVLNVLAALGASLALGLSAEKALAGITSLKGVPGRLERIQAGQRFTVLVDYAHTDDALRQLLETVRELQPRRVITVFGCGGDRDRSKRPLMGAVAARLSDVVFVTSDNPRSEPPEAILEEIQLGMNGGDRTTRHAIVDRHEAIAKALEIAGDGDAVVIAGKGHETIQVLRDRTVPFDDRQVVRDILGRLVQGGKA